MRRWLAALVVTSALSVAYAAPARGCSCGGPPVLTIEFEGEALDGSTMTGAGRLWRFHVTAAPRGVEPGDTVEIAIDGQEPPSPDGMRSSSSCSLGPSPRRGGVYRVGGYGGSTADGSPRYFANTCGGYVQETVPPPEAAPTNPSTAAPVGDPSPADPDESGPRHRTAASLAAVALGVVGSRTFRARRRASTAPADVRVTGQGQ